MVNPACSGIFYFSYMSEELLQFIWKFKRFKLKNLRTTQGQDLSLLHLGSHNRHSGPDFLNAQLEIDHLFWAGHIELHLKSSDWYAHGHHRDNAYENVILHVVWEADRPVYRSSGGEIPTLILRYYVDEDLLNSYSRLLKRRRKKFVNCEDQTSSFSLFVILPWLEHLYRQRLDNRLAVLERIFHNVQQDWERLLFIWMLRHFGQRVNGSCFYAIAQAIDFKVVRKIGTNTTALEALLFGIGGLLEKSSATDNYQNKLLDEFDFLTNKFGINHILLERPEFMGVRPPNFPTIRLSQFAVLYAKNQNLFSKIIAAKGPDELYGLLDFQATDYWTDHYNFSRPSVRYPKNLSKTFKDHLIINAIIPVKYFYAQIRGEENYKILRALIAQIAKERNSVVGRFRRIGFPVQHALDSQALLQLYNSYCRKNRCLECAIGNQLLN